MVINQRLNDYMVQHGLKQVFVAEKAGMKSQRLSAILNGKQKLTASEFLTICEVLNIDPKTFKGEAQSNHIISQ